MDKKEPEFNVYVGFALFFTLIEVWITAYAVYKVEDFFVVPVIITGILVFIMTTVLSLKIAIRLANKKEES